MWYKPKGISKGFGEGRMPTIISSTRLRNEYNAVAEECHSTGRPVFVTRNGNSGLAVMSMEAYELLASGATLLVDVTR
jgi:PHD/YefM family antitoxin component YafN of YafNO toxin-antitoxin module